MKIKSKNHNKLNKKPFLNRNLKLHEIAHPRYRIIYYVMLIFNLMKHLEFIA